MRDLDDMQLWFDRDGDPITIERWAILHIDLDYIHVEHDWVDDVAVSTVWLGIDHGFASILGGPGAMPVIFETMVFGGPLDLHVTRYATEDQARAGHAVVLADVRDLAVDLDQIAAAAARLRGDDGA